MSALQGEQVTVENIPIVRRRSELKKQSRQQHQVLRQRREGMERFERDTYDTIKFESVKSDTAGRKRELAKVLENNAEYQELKREVEKLEYQVKELDDVISDINFYQRERMVVAGNRYADAVDELTEVLKTFMGATGGMSETVEKFTEAVDKFAAARSR